MGGGVSSLNTDSTIYFITPLQSSCALDALTSPVWTVIKAYLIFSHFIGCASMHVSPQTLSGGGQRVEGHACHAYIGPTVL